MTTDTPPVAELHLHIEGTLEPEMVLALARRNGLPAPAADAEELRARYRFANLQSFLDLYYANMAVLRTEGDFADLTEAYLRRAAAGGVRHAEIMFDPQAHLARGVPVAVAVDGIAEALTRVGEELDVSTRLIAAFLRDRPEAEALEVLTALIDSGAPIGGVGLDSAEVGNPPEKFRMLYRVAREAGLVPVAHGGEEGGPEYVSGALDALKVWRVDHGIRAIEDPALVERLVAQQVPLTVCPLSNVRLRAVRTIESHPLRSMLEAGLRVTVNSDDPAYFGGYVDDNFRAVTAGLHLSRDQQAELARNSVLASVLSTPRSEALLAEVEAWRTAG